MPQRKRTGRKENTKVVATRSILSAESISSLEFVEKVAEEKASEVIFMRESDIAEAMMDKRTKQSTKKVYF